MYDNGAPMTNDQHNPVDKHNTTLKIGLEKLGNFSRKKSEKF